MKMQATSRNEERRNSAECTGFFATTTAIAVPSARTAKTTNAQPAPPVRRTPEDSVIVPSPLLDHGERLDVGGRPPVGELADVEVQRLVSVVGRHLVGLCRQPDGLGHRRACLLAE